MANSDIGLPMLVVTLSSQSVEITRTVIFTATVTGLGPFSFQWQKEGRNITGETGSTFVIYNISQNDQANYSCYVSNNYGDSVISNNMSLQVTSMHLTYAMNVVII